ALLLTALGGLLIAGTVTALPIRDNTALSSVVPADPLGSANPAFANAINVWREFSPAWDIAESGHAFLRREINAAYRKA
ncbi:MAG: hypothetical protein WCQ89_24100, partial [Verrucomicrobiota bacterium]